MGAIVRILPFTILILGTLGCGGPDQAKWVGHWKGSAELPPGVDSATNPFMANTLRLVKLEIRPDRTFVLVQQGVPLSGSVSIQRDSAQLLVERAMDRKLERHEPPSITSTRTIKLTWRKPGNEEPSLELRDPAIASSEPIILHPDRNP